MTQEAGPDWVASRVVSSDLIADGIRRITLERPHALGRPAAPGTHLDVRVRLGGSGGRTDVRSYSIVESDEAGRSCTVTVRLAVDGRGGSAFMHRLRPGDEVTVSRPLQNFPLALGADRYLLLAGGIGVTALVGSARALARAGAEYDLVYVGRSRAAMAYVDELGAEHGSRLRLHVDDEQGSLDVEALVQELDRRPGRTELLMCGPVRLMDAVRRAWVAADRPPTDLRFETFGNGGWFDAEPFEVSVPELGVRTTVAPDETLLDALTAAGAQVMWDCRKGECGLCLMAVDGLAGRIDHRDVFLSDRQKATNRLLCACVSRVVADPDGGARVALRTP